MESRIYKTLKQWFPEAFTDVSGKMAAGNPYEVLRHFAEYTLTLMNFDKENVNEPFKIIHLLYTKGTLYEKNAIENEFFRVISQTEHSLTLRQHLNIMPDELRAIYIKTILEN